MGTWNLDGANICRILTAWMDVERWGMLLLQSPTSPFLIYNYQQLFSYQTKLDVCCKRSSASRLLEVLVFKRSSLFLKSKLTIMMELDANRAWQLEWALTMTRGVISDKECEMELLPGSGESGLHLSTFGQGRKGAWGPWHRFSVWPWHWQCPKCKTNWHVLYDIMTSGGLRRVASQALGMFFYFYFALNTII